MKLHSWRRHKLSSFTTKLFTTKYSFKMNSFTHIYVTWSLKLAEFALISSVTFPVSFLYLDFSLLQHESSYNCSRKKDKINTQGNPTPNSKGHFPQRRQKTCRNLIPRYTCFTKQNWAALKIFTFKILELCPGTIDWWLDLHLLYRPLCVFLRAKK